MSTLSSLSVWSAVKFPFLKFSPGSVESCDDFKRRNHGPGKMSPEVVNLRIPWSQNKENSEPNLYCTRVRKKSKELKLVTVPGIQDKSAKNLPNSRMTNFETCESEQMPDEEFKREENIPSVKPWTVEELVQISKDIEEGKKMKRSKRKENINPVFSDLETSNELLHPDSKLANVDYDFFIHDQFYHYERFRSKFTKNTHKIQ